MTERKGLCEGAKPFFILIEMEGEKRFYLYNPVFVKERPGTVLF